MLVVLSGFSIYGDNVGDLIVSADEQTVRALSLSETGVFGAADSSTFLSAEGIKNIRDSTYYYIPENIRDGNGLKSDRETNRYFAYSFYLKNVSDVSVGYYATFKIDQQTNGIDKAIRIMVLIDDNDPVIYARPKADGTPESLEWSEDNVIKKSYTTIPFTEDEIEIARQSITEVNAVQKFTVVFWIEGWDDECKDNIVGGRFSGTITFRILESKG